VSQEPQNYRAASRFLAGLSAIVRLDDRDYPCQAGTLSRHGVDIAGELPPRLPGHVSLTLASAAGDLEFTAVARVVQIREGDEGTCVVGVEFPPLGDADQGILDALLARVIEGGTPAALANLSTGASPQEARRALEAIPVAHRISLAVRAQPRERSFLRHDPIPQVLEALARNPMTSLTEVRTLARTRHITPAALEIIAEDPRWRTNEDLRIILASHPNVAVPLAWRLAATLSDAGLDRLLRQPGLNTPLRKLLASHGGRDRLRRGPTR